MSAEADKTLALDTELTCLNCGYDLRGTVSGRCPECGREFDRIGHPILCGCQDSARRRTGKRKQTIPSAARTARPAPVAAHAR